MGWHCGYWNLGWDRWGFCLQDGWVPGFGLAWMEDRKMAFEVVYNDLLGNLWRNYTRIMHGIVSTIAICTN